MADFRPGQHLRRGSPTGVLNIAAKLCGPPSIIAAAEILPENLPEAWKDDVSSGLSIATALSVKGGKTLPWKTVRDVITSALHARFLELTKDSQAWPCDFPSAQFVRLKLAAGPSGKFAGGEMDGAGSLMK